MGTTLYLAEFLYFLGVDIGFLFKAIPSPLSQFVLLLCIFCTLLMNYIETYFNLYKCVQDNHSNSLDSGGKENCVNLATFIYL